MLGHKNIDKLYFDLIMGQSGGWLLASCFTEPVVIR